MTHQETQTGIVPYGYAGHYFELLSITGASVDLYFFDKDHVELGVEKAVGAGFYIDRRGLKGFASIDIDYGGAPQTVKFVVSDGTAGVKTASTNITANVPATGVPYTEGKFTTGIGVAANIRAANLARHYIEIQNPDTNANPVWVRSDGNAATQDLASRKINPGMTWAPFVAPTGAISIICAAAQDVHFIDA